MDVGTQNDQTNHHSTFLFYSSAFLLIFAPLIRGGNRPLALMLIELLSIFMLYFLIVKPEFLRHLNRWQMGILIVFVAYPLLYLVPIPVEIWQQLPGRELYAQVVFLLDTAPSWMPLSLHEQSTQMTWLASLPAVILFAALLGLPTRQLYRLVLLMMILCLSQALLGLIQYGSGSESFWRLGMKDTVNAVGSYANRNHFAGLLEMFIPIGIGLMIARISFHQTIVNTQSTRKQRLSEWFQGHGNFVLYFAFILTILLLAVVFSRSRTGLSVVMLGIFLSAMIFIKRIGGQHGSHFISVIIFLAFIFAAEIGLAPVLQRFSLDSAMEDARWTLFQTTFQAIGEFFPLGSGPGTFTHVYHAFQPIEISARVMHAHNDYLEWFMESGLIAFVLIIGFVLLYIRQFALLLMIKRWSLFNFVQAGAGIGILSMLLHSFTDFNLHIPANALYFAFLCALLVHKEDQSMQPVLMKPKHRVRQNQPDIISRKLKPKPDVKNPFSE